MCHVKYIQNQPMGMELGHGVSILCSDRLKLKLSRIGQDGPHLKGLALASTRKYTKTGPSLLSRHKRTKGGGVNKRSIPFICYTLWLYAESYSVQPRQSMLMNI
jgi:hypothetical protein